MSLARTAIATPRVAGRRSSRVRDFGPWVVAGCYLLGALAVTWRLWSDPAGQAQIGDTPDVDLFAWPWRSLAIMIAALVILPLAPLPYQAAAVTPTPSGWQAAFARLRVAPAAHVLVIPVPFQIHPQVLRWQAGTGAPGSLVGGYFIGPNQTGHAAEDPADPASTLARYLDALWAGGSPAPRPSEAQIRADLEYWRPAAVVAVTSPAAPLGRFLVGLFGPPSYRAGDVLAWRFLGPPPGATGGRA